MTASHLHQSERDGFEIVRLEDGQVIDFVPCEFSDHMREAALAGLLSKLREDCTARDTRDEGTRC